MSENLKFFKGSEMDLPVANPNNAGNIYHCEDTGNTYLSNGSSMILFASAVGRKELTGGAIFGDYGTNGALGENSESHGTGTYTESANQAAFGTYNANDAANIFEVGIGDSDDNRENGFAVTNVGNIKINKDISNNAYSLMPISFYIDMRNGSIGMVNYVNGIIDIQSLTNRSLYSAVYQQYSIASSAFKRPIKFILMRTREDGGISELIGHCYYSAQYQFTCTFIDAIDLKVITVVFSNTAITFDTKDIASQNILTGINAPSNDLGKDGDLYIMPHDERIPTVYSGTTVPNAAVGIDGDIYILYEA